jgi:hypothetical protein
MDPQERVEGCGLTQLVQDNIQWWDLVNMSVPHVVGNFKHLNNYQHLRSTLPYSIFTGRTVTHITGSYINTTSKCLIIHIIISCLNLVMNKLKYSKQ